jgi:hypothetical protein
VSERYPSEEQYYQDYGQPEYVTYDEDTRPADRTRLMTVILAVAVLACSCLSCLIGAGLGILFWETGGTGQAAAKPTTPGWQDVISAFNAAGLECVDPQPITQDEYADIFVAQEVVEFLIPSQCDACFGRILVFESSRDPNLTKAKRYLGESPWVFGRDKFLVTISNDTPEAEALKYRTALARMKG